MSYEINLEKLEKVKQEAEEFYATIGDVFCPYLKGEVSFNAKGLEHLKFKERGKARVVMDQYVRLKLLPLAPRIIRQSNTLQELFETKRLEQQKINSRWERRLVSVTYYGFVAIINGARIKIIVKDVKGGNKFFWSLIPFWKYNKKGEGGRNIPYRNKKILHAGDLETD